MRILSLQTWLVPAHTQHFIRQHSHHTHKDFSAKNSATTFKEGCACQQLGFDFDEAASAAHGTDAKSSAQLTHVPDTKVELGLTGAVGFLGLGAMATGYKMIKGACATLKRLTLELLPKIKAQREEAENILSTKQRTLRLRPQSRRATYATHKICRFDHQRVKNLKAYEETLKQSQGLQKFFKGIGALTLGQGVALCIGVFVWPAGLAALALSTLYFGVHVVRYSRCELQRLKKSPIIKKPLGVIAEQGQVFYQKLTRVRIRLYELTRAAFAISAVGSVSTLLGLVLLPTPLAPIGAGLMLAGIIALSLGVSSTLVLNNSKTMKDATPKNNDAKINRAELGSKESIMRQIGRLQNQTHHLKTFKQTLKVCLTPQQKARLFALKSARYLLLGLVGIPTAMFTEFFVKKINGILHYRQNLLLHYQSEHLPLYLLTLARANLHSEQEYFREEANYLRYQENLFLYQMQDEKISRYLDDKHRKRVKDDSHQQIIKKREELREQRQFNHALLDILNDSKTKDQSEQLKQLWAYLKHTDELDSIVAEFQQHASTEESQWIIANGTKHTAEIDNLLKVTPVIKRKFIQTIAMYLLDKQAEDLDYRQKALADHLRARILMS